MELAISITVMLGLIGTTVSACWAAAWAVNKAVASHDRRAMRRLEAVPWVCGGCGYPSRDWSGPRCPECGTDARDVEPLRATEAMWRQRGAWLVPAVVATAAMAGLLIAIRVWW